MGFYHREGCVEEQTPSSSKEKLGLLVEERRVWEGRNRGERPEGWSSQPGVTISYDDPRNKPDLLSKSSQADVGPRRPQALGGDGRRRGRGNWDTDNMETPVSKSGHQGGILEDSLRWILQHEWVGPVLREGDMVPGRGTSKRP